VITVVLGVLTAHSTGPAWLDRGVDSWIQANLGVHQRAMRLFEAVGQPLELAFLTLIVVLACLAVRRVNGAILAVVSVLASVVLTELVLKPLSGRTLDGNLVYPSGHTGRTFTLATVIVVLVLNPPAARPRTALKIAVALAGGLVGCAVAVAMIGLNDHYFTDTVGGAALAIAVVLAASFLLDMQSVRRRMHPTKPEP
jgi:membrane-associated phospholipid phosphatase